MNAWQLSAEGKQSYPKAFKGDLEEKLSFYTRLLYFGIRQA